VDDRFHTGDQIICLPPVPELGLDEFVIGAQASPVRKA
jgi:hypothetical protein